MFYESANSMRANLCKTESGADFSFPLHLHSSFEWITVTEGEMQVTVDGVCHTLRKGESVLIFPHQTHSLHTPTHSRHFLCIFSQKLVQAYSKSVTGKRPKSNVFTLTPFFRNALLSAHVSECSEYRLKGLLYSLCSEFDVQAEYVERRGDGAELLDVIFDFVERNYTKDCSLHALSAHTGYHYVYLSHCFKQYTGLSYTDYVIRYRVNEASYRLRNGTETILQTAYDCGFDSLRSFNRNFKRVTALTPQECRDKKG